MRRWVERRLVAFLTTPVARYERYGADDPDALRRTIHKGDVLLSQGDQRLSAIIRYLTQSPWSHATLYLGDELLQHGGELAAQVRERYGDEADSLLLDVMPEGVGLAPLSKYARFNLRLCRARLAPDDLKTVLEQAIASLGWHYDVRNLVDLARYYLPAEIVPARLRPRGPRLGSSASATVICTSLIGGLFHSVGYPVHPAGVRRDSSLLAPCDFDRSPYFEIVPFQLPDGGFDYRGLARGSARRRGS